MIELNAAQLHAIEDLMYHAATNLNVDEVLDAIDPDGDIPLDKEADYLNAAMSAALDAEITIVIRP